ncbi:MAG: beta-L-arabinofuranosidase domain-containing protein, partial [bacterium]
MTTNTLLCQRHVRLRRFRLRRFRLRRFWASLVLWGCLCSVALAEEDPQNKPTDRKPIAMAAQPIPLSDVRLTGGPLKHAQDLDAEHLLRLESDRMLAFYRERAGLKPKAKPYGGWDGPRKNLTGHIGGHYLSAVSLMWAATGDERFKQRADYMVRELKEVQDKHGDGYLCAFEGGRECFEKVSKGEIPTGGFDLNGLWVPWYTLHKTMAGLRDAYRYTGNRTALEMEAKIANWARGVLADLNEEQIQKMLDAEFGGMNEVLADLYADTGERRWLDLSYRFEHHTLLT